MDIVFTRNNSLLSQPDRVQRSVGPIMRDGMIERPVNHMLFECNVGYDVLYDAYRTLFETTFRPYDHQETETSSPR